MKITKAEIHKKQIAQGLTALYVYIPEELGFKEGEEVIISIRRPLKGDGWDDMEKVE